MLVDITEDIKEGKFDHPKLSFKAHKLFGRRIFVLIGGAILLGHLQYTFDQERNVLIIYINFDYRKNRNMRKETPMKMKIREYSYESGMDLDLYLSKVRKEIIRDKPQSEGFTWSFNGRDLL